jgi:hypothetical protein
MIVKEIGISTRPPSASHTSGWGRELLRAALSWIALTAAFGWAFSTQLAMLFDISRNAAQSNGTITRTDCDNHPHRTFTYTFFAGGREYSGWGYAGCDCRSLHLGDPITVYYSSISPENNITQDPNRRLSVELWLDPLLSVLCPSLFIAYLEAAARRKRRRFQFNEETE